MKRLEGKVAVVTGGNSGIGLASARRLHEEGARVVITGRDPRTLDAAVSAIGAGTVAVQSDVSNLSDIERLFSLIASKVGKIDVLFANAGIAIGSGTARAAGAARDAMVSAGHKAKTSTKNALASAAGVRRTPMREWSPPTTGESTSSAPPEQ